MKKQVRLLLFFGSKLFETLKRLLISVIFIHGDQLSRLCALQNEKVSTKGSKSVDKRP